MPFTTLRALHTTIGDALAELERVYQAHPGSVDGAPLDFPDLDVPYYATSPSNRDADAAEKLAVDPAAVVAARQIVAACGQLSASVHQPFFSLVDVAMSGNLAACIGFLEASNAVEILRAAGPEGLHVEEIARRVVRTNVGAAAVDPTKLSHILRFLATHHWLKEVRPDIFANNRLSALLDTGKTPDQLSAAPEKKYEETDGIAAFVSMTCDDMHKAGAYLTDAFFPDRTRSATLRALRGQHRVSDATSYNTPFNAAFSTEGGYFDWLELPQNKARLTDFGRAMTGARGWETAENILGAFPWKELPENAVVVDVGGGVGSTSVVIANAFPHLRFVVQDRPQVVNIAPSVWEAPNSELITSGRVSFQAQDFFSPQPTTLDVPGVGAVATADVFVLRGCTHNWPDSQVIKMLKPLRAAAKPSTKLIIVETLLNYACPSASLDSHANEESGTLLAGAHPPLLANLGLASANHYSLDISMLAVLDARERTPRELIALAREAGWDVAKIFRPHGTLWGYITFVPV